MIAKSKIAKLRKFINGPENEVFWRCMIVSWVAVQAICLIRPTSSATIPLVMLFAGFQAAFMLSSIFIQNPEPL